jgi:hypothetical protein
MPSQLKVEHIGDNDFEVLGLQAETDDFCSMWLGIGHYSLYIKREAEGLVVDLYVRGMEDRNHLSSMQGWDNDVQDYLESDESQADA